MSDDQLAMLLKESVGDPPNAIDVDALMRRASGRRTQRWTGYGLIAAAMLILAGVGVGQLWPTNVAAPAGSPSVAASASGSPAGTPSPSSPVGEKASCPKVLPGTSNAVVDYIDLFIWNGVQYEARYDATELPKAGTLVTTIGCSITELMRDNRNRVEAMPWPDRTSTFLPSGTKVYAAEGKDRSCALIATTHDGPRLYQVRGSSKSSC